VIPSRSKPDVLVLAYNRPEILRKTLAAIPREMVGGISIWVDGPKNVADDTGLVRRTARVAEEFLDSAQDSLVVNKTNMGCRKSVTAGIDAFLTTRSCGIILEDDVVVTPTFVRYATAGLNSGPTLNSSNLGSMTGLNLVPPRELGLDQPFRLSRYFSSWGWATWSRQWEKMSTDLQPWREYRDAIRCTPGLSAATAWHLKRTYGKILNGSLDSWAYVTLLEHIRLGLVVLVPSLRMISNIGFGDDATHTMGPIPWYLDDRIQVATETEWLSTNLHLLPNATWDREADRYMSAEVYSFLSPWSPGRLSVGFRRLATKRF